MLVPRWLHRLDLYQIQYLAKNKFGNTHLTTMQLLSKLKQLRSSQPRTRTDSFLDSALLGQYKGIGLSLVMGGWVEHVYWATQQARIYFFQYWRYKYFNCCCRFYPQLLPSCLHLAAWHLLDASVDILTTSVSTKVIWWCLRQFHCTEAWSKQAQHSDVWIRKHRKDTSRKVSCFSYTFLYCQMPQSCCTFAWKYLRKTAVVPNWLFCT